MEVDGLTVDFRTSGGVLRAVDDVSFDLRPHEVLAIVGESGSGKSVTALSLMKLIATPPGRYAAGQVNFDGRDLLATPERRMTQIRGKRISMIFQNPRAALDPSFAIADQMREVLRRHFPELDRAAADMRARDMLVTLRFAEPDRVLASYPHQLSGGMCQRVSIAIALLCEPEILIADEPTTALDVLVQTAILDLLATIHRERGLPILIVTHDFNVVRAIATRVIVMYGGCVQEQGSVEQVLNRPKHPYTRALLAAVPEEDRFERRLSQIDGQPPDLLAPPAGCLFEPRCTEAIAGCRAERPALHAAGEGAKVRCHLHAPAASAPPRAAVAGGRS